jgi:polysaccharide biosynthesis/export protein
MFTTNATMLNKKRRLFKIVRIHSYLLLLVLVISCTDTKKVTYFNGVTDGNISANTQVPESVIQKNDILSITIGDINPEGTRIFNPNQETNNPALAGPNTIGNSQGYLVNTDGFIQFPILGNIKAEGLTKTQLRDKISKTILDKKLLADPIVTIRFMNFRVTVLGEVNHPTVLTVPSEKISLLEAIGLAGDLTLYGKRQNVMIIREEDGKKTMKHIDLNSSELFTSKYYYLQSNDIVYVEPNKAKVAQANRSAQWLPILLSGLSLAAIVADRLTN